MNVIILTGELYPNGLAATNRIKSYARAIQEGGLDCEVLIYRRTEVYGKPARNVEGKGTYAGVPFRYIGGTPQRGSNIFIRQLNDRLDVWRTEKYLYNKLKKGDVLLLYMGRPVELMLRFMKVAHQKGAFCVRDLCELPYGTGLETSKTIKLRKKTLENQFPILDGVFCISSTLLDLAKKYTSPSCKLIKVPIMVEYDNYCMEDRADDADIPYIFHAGTLYQQKDGILGMIEAFGIACQNLKKPIRFISTGFLNKSPHKDEIKNLIEKYHIEDKILFTGYLSEQELKDYLSKASMVIINKYLTQQNIYCFSTKLGEYMAASKPIIITRVGEAMNWLRDGDNAYLVDPGDTNSLSEVIVHVFNNPNEAKIIGKKGQLTCHKDFDFRSWSKPIVDFLKNLAD